MTEAVSVRRDGDTFQARLFWRYAARLLDSVSPVARVGFESGPKSFDDIWVEYDPGKGPQDQYGEPLRRVHVQCKWHVSPDTYGHLHLVDPEFINANARSFLQRALDAQRTHAADGGGVRFKLVTNWRLDRADPLREMISTRSTAIRAKRLYAAGENSRSGAVRRAWRDHLNLTEDELVRLAGTLAFGEATDSLDDLRDILDTQFSAVGLRRIPAHESAFPYDDLVYQWMSQGSLDFDGKAFQAICKREGLLAASQPATRVYGVKSFEHPIDQLEQRCDAVLDLVPAFDERFIRNDEDWSGSLYPQLKEFLLAAAREHEVVRLVLDAHASLAFAAGSVLNLKAGRKVELEQRTNGRSIWSADDRPHDPDWPTFTSELVEFDPAVLDIAVAIGLTHDVAADVQAFIKRSNLKVGRLLALSPTSKANGQAVACGRHAYELSQLATEAIRQLPKSPGTRLHVFVAAPNGYTFFLGQHQPLLGPLTLYEFDFEGSRDLSYIPALSLPIQ